MKVELRNQVQKVQNNVDDYYLDSPADIFLFMYFHWFVAIEVLAIIFHGTSDSMCQDCVDFAQLVNMKIHSCFKLCWKIKWIGNYIST